MNNSRQQASAPNAFSEALLTESQLYKLEIPPREPVIHGLIINESITVISGARGAGKSFLAMEIGNEVTWGGNVGPWRVDGALNVLYVDGEMQRELYRERLQGMNLGRNLIRKPGTFYLYSDAHAYHMGLRATSLLDEEWRDVMLREIDDMNIGLLILDNLSALAPGIDENEKLDFDPISQWLKQVRHHGIAIIVIHHVGKSGDQRGTSAREDNVDTSLVLNPPKDYDQSTDGCTFEIKATKDRANIITHMPAKFTLTGDGIKKRLRLEMDKRSCSVEDVVEAIRSTLPDYMSYKEAVDAGYSQRTYYRALEMLKERGEVD